MSSRLSVSRGGSGGLPFPRLYFQHLTQSRHSLAEGEDGGRNAGKREGKRAQKKLSPDSGSSEEGAFQCVRRGFQGGHEAPAGFIKREDLESRGERGGACMGLV